MNSNNPTLYCFFFFLHKFFLESILLLVKNPRQLCYNLYKPLTIEIIKQERTRNIKRGMFKMDELEINLILVILLGILISIFTVKATKTRHYVPYFIISFIFVFSGALIYILISMFLPNFSDEILIPLELMFFGISQFFMYLFLESLRSINRSRLHFAIIIISLIIQQFSLFLLIFLPFCSNVTDLIWLSADISYNVMGIITNFLLGIPFYFHNFKRSHKKTTIILIIAFSLNSLGYLFLFLADIFWFFEVLPGFQAIVFDMGNALPIIGLFIILGIYIVDIHHFYQLPSDLFVLMISNDRGEIVFQSKYEKNSAPLIKYKISMPDLLNAINKIFSDIFMSKRPIKVILTEEISMLREVGSQFSAVIISNSGSIILASALRRFLEDFEQIFQEKVLSGNSEINSSDFINHTVELLMLNFPFLNNEK